MHKGSKSKAFVLKYIRLWRDVPCLLDVGGCHDKATIIRQAQKFQLRTTFGDEAPCKTAIYNWFAECKRGRANLSGEFSDGRPCTAMNNKNIDAVRHMIETDKHVIYHQIRASFGIGMSQIQSNLRKNLDMKKLCLRWIPYNLTEAHKTDRVTWCSAMLARLKEFSVDSNK
ncbi:Putative uncharacterized protein FLJ37770 [Eumeta japonica]|uniref:Histone-lysine N-methyltransferase SETMAR n=1 Tax=Eumeta variegata TaxID=151549 RepID=A0A4C1XYP6_EUMVA|nr:Putative uncharacterized protein FLJ37770 [Eumeta japonica]